MEWLDTQNKRVILHPRWTRLLAAVGAALLLAFFYFLIVLTPHIASAENIHHSNLPASQNASLIADSNSLLITKTHVGDFFIGGQGNYRIQVRNETENPIPGTITVTDLLPSVLAYQSFVGEQWLCSHLNQKIICTYTETLGKDTSLPPLTITVNIPAPGQASVSNKASIKTDSEWITSTEDTVALQGTDLEVLKTVSPASAAPGATVVFMVTVKNNGPNQAVNVVILDQLPEDELTYVSNIASQGTYNPTTGLWSIGNITSSSQATLSINATIKQGACDKIINATGNVTSDTPDFNPANNKASVTLSVQNTCLHGVVRSATTSDVLSNATVSIRDSANHVYSTQTNAGGWYTFTNTTSNPLVAGSATLTASRNGYRTKVETINLTSNTLNVRDVALEGAADLLITKTDSRTTVIPGQTITYSIGVTNTGTLAAIPVVITDVLSSQLRLSVDSLFGQAGVISKTIDHTRIWTLTNGLPPGEGRLFTLRAIVSNPLAANTVAVTNTIRVVTASFEENVANNVAQDVDFTPNPSLSKSVTPSEAGVNTRFTFTIQVRNNGKVDMTNVVVNDVFPSYLTYYSATVTKGTYSFNTTTRTFTASVGTMTPNEVVTLTVYMTVNSTATTTQILNNTATMTYQHGGVGLSHSSNTISYRVLGSGSLPGTGGIEHPSSGSPAFAGGGFIVALISAILVFLAGMAAIIYALRARRLQSAWYQWSLNMGILLVVVAAVFGLAAWGLSGVELNWKSKPAPQVLQSDLSTETSIPQPTLALTGWQHHETLPDYPVPTPTAFPEGTPDQPLDDSSPTRLFIPALDLDAIVKYVPYDGFSWLISGLQHEIAWLGDTSWPGLGGNTALAGHVTLRNGSDGPFRYLENLKNGDEIVLFTENNIYHYQVREQFIVNDSDMSVVKPDGETRLTLITCAGWNSELGHYIQRLIIVADLVEVKPLATRGY